MDITDEIIEENGEMIDLLNDFNDNLDKMTINELISIKIESIKEIKNKFINWYNEKIEPKINLRFDYENDLLCRIPKDILIIELREQDDLYDSYIGGYQHLIAYSKDIINKKENLFGLINKSIKWYKNAYKIILKSDLKVLNSLIINYSWTFTNKINQEKTLGNTKFLIYY